MKIINIDGGIGRVITALPAPHAIIGKIFPFSLVILEFK